MKQNNSTERLCLSFPEIYSRNAPRPAPDKKHVFFSDFPGFSTGRRQFVGLFAILVRNHFDFGGGLCILLDTALLRFPESILGKVPGKGSWPQGKFIGNHRNIIGNHRRVMVPLVFFCIFWLIID